MTCKYCGKKIKPCPYSAPAYPLHYVTKDGIHLCPPSMGGDHEPEPEDKQ